MNFSRLLKTVFLVGDGFMSLLTVAMLKEYPLKNIIISGHHQNRLDLAKELEEFACSNENWVYHHSWEVGDAVIWDNRCLMHRASMWDLNEGRIMYHSRIEGDPISEAASNYL